MLLEQLVLQLHWVALIIKIISMSKRKYIISGFLYLLAIVLIFAINFMKIKENTFLVFYIGLSIVPLLLIYATKILKK